MLPSLAGTKVPFLVRYFQCSVMTKYIIALLTYLKTTGKPAKRSRGLKPRQPWMERQLIVSSLAEHYAEIVCSSETSWGPDFVGSDGMFCDMGTKTLSPLCSTEEVDGCVNINTTDNTVSKVSSVAKRQVEMSYKTYDKIKQWS